MGIMGEPKSWVAVSMKWGKAGELLSTVLSTSAIPPPAVLVSLLTKHLLPSHLLKVRDCHHRFPCLCNKHLVKQSPPSISVHPWSQQSYLKWPKGGSKWPWMDKRTNKMWWIHTMKHYSARMNLEDFTLSEIRWSQEEKSSKILRIGGTWNSQIHRHRKTGEMGGRKRECLFDGWRVSAWEDEELWSRTVVVAHNSVNIFNATGLHSSKRWTR